MRTIQLAILTLALAGCMYDGGAPRTPEPPAPPRHPPCYWTPDPWGGPATYSCQ
jgi:hypothetical protein